MARSPFVPSETYLIVLGMLGSLSTEELNRLKLTDIHHEQMDRQGRTYSPDEGKPIGSGAVNKAIN
jgi:hypothetical protein